MTVAALTTLREAVMAKLDEDLAETWAIEWVAGKIEGGQQNYNVGCVYPLRGEPTRRDDNMREELLVVRVFLSRIDERDPTVTQALDPTPLESLETDVIRSLQPVQGSQAFQAGYFLWLGTDFDNDLQAIEAHFRAYHRSEFAIGG
jgi:hypothetical protein